MRPLKGTISERLSVPPDELFDLISTAERRVHCPSREIAICRPPRGENR